MNDPTYKYTPESILEALHSIKRISIEEGELDTWIGDDASASSVREYMQGSFTRDLLELIEKHLLT